MSEEITSWVPPRSALFHIWNIESQCESIPVSENFSIYHGPFGVFRLRGRTGVNEEHPSPVDVAQDENVETDALAAIDEELPVFDGSLMSPNTQTALCSLMYDQSSDLDLALWDAAAGFDELQNAAINEPYSSIDFDAAQLPFLASEGRIPPHSPGAGLNNQLTISRSATPVTCAQIDIPQSAWVLLKHYLNNVLKAMTPFHHSKTPWHILFVPLVKSCLAGLALQDDVDRATLCVFYGTLAISAASLSSTSQSSNWSRKSDTYRERAYEHAKASLESAYDMPKKAKYKTQLMALLTMAQMTTISGHQDQTEYFLLEAEKFIRMRGLNRRKSRKVRLLHHCYAYERIFFESTVVRNAASSLYQRHVARAIEESGAGAYSRDTLSFRLGRWDNLEADVLKVKDRESGENDLHLQIPGAWPDTLYPEIFGVPEVHVLIVSLIIRLSRERETQDTDDSSSTLDLKSFMSRAKAIEKLIRLQKPPIPTPNTGLAHLIEATYHALVIYFYRKIHDIDSSILQQQVSSVRDCLIRYEYANTEKGFASMRLIWPAYVAACEADDPIIQKSFLEWFETAAQESGLPLFTARLDSIKEVWREKHGEVVPMFAV